MVIDQVGTLTDEHAGSSGQPVIVGKGGKAFGSGDVFEVDGGPQPAWQVVQHWLEWTKPEGNDQRLAQVFIRLGQVTGGNGGAGS